MSVQCDVPYKGITVTGATFTVKSAYHKQIVDPAASFLVYQCEVTMPDGSIQRDTGWESVKSYSPDLTIGPLADAEIQMKARLAAAGATSMVDL